VLIRSSYILGDLASASPDVRGYIFDIAEIVEDVNHAKARGAMVH
jgi:hypothetical protein